MTNVGWAKAAVLVWLGSAASAVSPADPMRFPGEPGSGEPLEELIRPTNRERLRLPVERVPQTTGDAEALAELERLSLRYNRAFDAAADTAITLLHIEGEIGRRAIRDRYEAKIRTHRRRAEQLRAQVIRRYEDFLKLHPGDETWTPEIMFRLANLHLERARDRLAEAEEDWQKQLEAYQVAAESDPDLEPPPSPIPDYGDVLVIYGDILARFPRYHRGDATLYMMGALFEDMQDIDAAQQSYLALACDSRFDPPNGDPREPLDAETYDGCEPWRRDSDYTQEAWLRLGEMHYDADEYEPALSAYAQVAKDPEAEFYGEALVRLAWTLYLLRRFPAAAERFDEFVLYADAHRDRKDDGGAIGLRDDAVRYLAKTYIESDWDQDGRNDAIWGQARLDRDYHDRNERHVPEIYAALGDLLAQETRYLKAIALWERTLAKWPLAPVAPSIQARILDAYDLLNEPENVTVARDRLATEYLRETPWFYANEHDPEAIEKAFALAEGALVATALEHHAKAQQLRADGDVEQARSEYQVAARAYEAYLERFPDTPSSYEYRFNFAESLYYSEQFEQAAEQYGRVRDSNIDDRLQEDAASGAVLAIETFVEAEVQAGHLDLPPMPREGVEGESDRVLDIPPLMLDMRDTYDRFVAIMPTSEQVASMKYLAGEISQKYHHFDDAQRRFEDVLDQHCEDNAAIKAGLAILDGKVVLGELDEARAWTQKLGASGCGQGEEAEKFAGQLRTLGNAVRFKEATLLYDAGKFEAAADRYVALVNEAPQDPNADRALNNAAVAYENIGRFGSASQTYQRIYTDYPDSEFADSALLRTGFNHSRFFEFEEAVQSYLVLAEDPRYADSDHRMNALWNAGDLLDNLQQYGRSAAMFERYAAVEPDRGKAAEAAFRAAQVRAKTEEHRATIRAYETFLAQFGSAEGQSEAAVAAHLAIGKAYATLGNRHKAEEAYRSTVQLFETRGLKPATDAADYPSEAQFLLAEYALQDVLATKVRSTGRKMEKEVQELTDRLLEASSAYDKVFPYRRIDWVLAAMFRRGYAFETWAINIREAPIPRALREYSEAWFAYQDVVDQFATQAEAKALTLYEQTLERGKEFNMANQWTRAARERINIYKPEEFPLLRQPALDLQLESL